MSDMTERQLRQSSARLRKAAAKLIELTPERDFWISVAHASGASLSQIAEATGLSRTGVDKILQRKPGGKGISAKRREVDPNLPAWIYEARRRGASVEQIAEMCKIPKAAVLRILAKENQATA